MLEPRAAQARRFGVAPHTEAERGLAAIWCDLLGVDRVDVDDNFFEAGGHSLLMVRLQARIRGAFGLDLPMMELFQAPTIRAQARLVTAGTQVTYERSV
jgi:aryl carrier-like protein